MATAFGVQMGHHEEPQMAAHLLAAIPHGTYVECFHPDRDPFWWNLVANRPEPVGGEVPLPQPWVPVPTLTCHFCSPARSKQWTPSLPRKAQTCVPSETGVLEA